MDMRRQQKSILLVEDHAKLASFLRNNLVDAGYAVAIECRGDKAVYRIIQETPDLVILDVMLPGMNGRQICHTVRHEYKGKIMMLTALNDITSEINSLNLGADDYLTKPIDSMLLLARIAALLRRPTSLEISNHLHFGVLHIDFIKHEVSLANKLIELSPSEFELLALLAKNADSCLSRDNIAYVLRGREYDGIDRSIDLRISYLRKKLCDDTQKPYKIKTIHSKGYMFMASAWEIL